MGVFGGVGGSEGEFFRIQISDDSPPAPGGGGGGGEFLARGGGSGGSLPPVLNRALNTPTLMCSG